MVQKYVFQICQKLAIAAALAATFYCLPLVAQTVQPDSANAQKTSIDDTQILQLKDGRKISYAELTVLSENKKDEILGLAKPSQQDKFNTWELAQANQRIAEKDRNIDAINARIAETDVALKLSQEFGVVLDEIFKEISAPKPATPEQKAINKKRAATIKAALEHPLVGGSKKYSPLSRQIAQQLAKSLEAGENINWADKKMIQSLSETIK